MVLSFFVLGRFREESTRQIQERFEQRAQAKQARAAESDEAVEDAEDERADDGRTEYR